MLVAASMLSADSLNIERDLHAMEKCGIDMHHVDVMDGHFVPNLTFGEATIRALKKRFHLTLDVHIMVSNPDLVAVRYLEAGVDRLSFPLESAMHHHKLLSEIRSHKKKAGVAINPGTSLSLLDPLYPYLDIVNVMSVNPGFGGQSFIEGSLKRIESIKSSLRSLGLEKSVQIEVDGGVSDKTAKSLESAGADVLIAGSYLYGASDKKAAVETLKNP